MKPIRVAKWTRLACVPAAVTELFSVLLRLPTHPASDLTMTLVLRLSGCMPHGAPKAPLIEIRTLGPVLRVSPVTAVTLEIPSAGPVGALTRISPAPG